MLFIVVAIIIHYVPISDGAEDEYFLTLYSREKRATVRQWKIYPNDTISLKFIQSLYKVPQWEVYKVTDNYELYVEKCIFGSYEAAQYYDIHNGFYLRDDGMYEEKVNEISHCINFRMGFKADHTVTVNGEEFFISEVAHAGEALTLLITKSQ